MNNDLDKILWNGLSQAVSASVNAPAGTVDTTDITEEIFVQTNAALQAHILAEVLELIGEDLEHGKATSARIHVEGHNCEKTELRQAAIDRFGGAE